MRFIHRLIVATIATLSPAAWAGSDSSELPNPFTDLPNPSATLTTGGAITGSSGLAPPPAIVPPPGSDFTAPSGAQSNAPVPAKDEFYQAAKKDLGKQ